MTASPSACLLTSIEPAAEMLAFVEKQFRNLQLYAGLERRSERRNMVILPVVGQMINDDYQPIDDPFALVTRDLSPTGVGLVHSHEVAGPLLALQLLIAGETVNAVARIQWQRYTGPYFYSGARFQAKLAQFPC